MLYVLLGPEHQVEVKETAVDAALFLAAQSVTPGGGWLVFRQIVIPDTNQLSELARHFMVAESVEQQTYEALNTVESRRR